MRVLPKIYVVSKQHCDLHRAELLCWFFDEDEAEEWVERNKGDSQFTHYEVVEVDPVGCDE